MPADIGFVRALAEISPDLAQVSAVASVGTYTPAHFSPSHQRIDPP